MVKVYTKKIYLCDKGNIMKLLSLKMDEAIFRETEEITDKLKKARNRYINEAVELYNLYNKKKLYRKQLEKESRAVAAGSLKMLKEFEKLADAYQAL